MLRRFWDFRSSPFMGVNLFWKFKILKRALLRPAGPGIRNSPRPEKLWTTLGLKCSGQQLNFDFFDLGMPGNPDPPKSGKRVQFQISPEKLEKGLSTSKSSPGSILIWLQYKKTQLFFGAAFWIFRILPLWVPTYSGHLKSWIKPFWGQRGLAFEIRRGPKNAERHEGLNAVASNWLENFLDLGTPGNPNPKPTKSRKKIQFQISPEKLVNGLGTSKSSPGSILILLQYKYKKQSLLL